MSEFPKFLNAAETLRSPASAIAPDPRTGMLASQKPLSFVAHHEAVAAIRLNSAVPERVAINFETARNLYLYAWHVYRFYPVAAAHALSTLEFGLRERLPDRLLASYQNPKQKHAMLNAMLRYAIDQNLIRNEGLRRWHDAAATRPRLGRDSGASTSLDGSSSYNDRPATGLH